MIDPVLFKMLSCYSFTIIEIKLWWSSDKIDLVKNVFEEDFVLKEKLFRCESIMNENAIL